MLTEIFKKDARMYKYLKSRVATLSEPPEIFAFFILCVPILMGIFIFFNPFPHTTSIKEVCYYLSAFIVIALLCLKKVKFSFKTPLLWPFSFFVLWAFLTIFFSVDRANSIHDFYSHLIRYIIIYYILINFFNTKKRFVVLAGLIIISSSIFSVGGLYYYYYIEGHSLATRFGLTFVQVQTNSIGFAIIIALIFSLHQFSIEKILWHKALLIACSFVLFLTMLLTQTRSYILAIFLAVLILFSKKLKMLFVIMMLLVFTVTMTPVKNRFVNMDNMDNISNSIRLKQNALSFEIIKEHPIVGTGFGIETYRKLNLDIYKDRLPEKYKSREFFNYAHNMYFNLAVRVGIVGFALFFYIILKLFMMILVTAKNGRDNFIRGWTRSVAASIVAFLTIGFFEPIFHHVAEVIFCTMLSMVTILWRLNEVIPVPFVADSKSNKEETNRQ